MSAWVPGADPDETVRRDGNYEYLISAGFTLSQRNRCAGMIEQRRECPDIQQACRLADEWAADAAIAGGPW